MSDHAYTGASNSGTWMNCPGSIQFYKTKTRKASVFAAEGSVAHHIAECILRDQPPPLSGTVVKQDGFDITVDADMHANVSVYTEHCLELAQEADSYGVEERVYLDALWGGLIPPEPCFGTIDFWCVTNDTLRLRDLKFGKGVPVEVINNTQLLYYGLGMYLTLEEDYGETIEHVEIGIVQPRVDHPDGPIRVLRITRDELLNWGYTQLKPAVERTVDEDPTFTAGKWCRWCPGSGSCVALANKTQAVAKSNFYDQIAPSKHELSSVELAHILEWKPIITKALDECVAELQRRIEEDGEIVEGVALKPARTIRQWSDEEALMKEAMANGVDPKTIAKVKVSSVAQVEKALKGNPDVWHKLEGFVVKPDKGNTVVWTGGDTQTASVQRSPAREKLDMSEVEV